MVQRLRLERIESPMRRHSSCGGPSYPDSVTRSFDGAVTVRQPESLNALSKGAGRDK